MTYHRPQMDHPNLTEPKTSLKRFSENGVGLELSGDLAILPNNKKGRYPMERKIKARYEARSKILKALAHPTRLFIVDELEKGERCVCDLTDMIGADVSTVSKHLSVLKNAGIVSDDKRGNQVFYSLRVHCVLDWYACVEGVLAKNREELAGID